jgi:hypothetical protein
MLPRVVAPSRPAQNVNLRVSNRSRWNRLTRCPTLVVRSLRLGVGHTRRRTDDRHGVRSHAARLEALRLNGPQTDSIGLGVDFHVDRLAAVGTIVGRSGTKGVDLVPRCRAARWAGHQHVEMGRVGQRNLRLALLDCKRPDAAPPLRCPTCRRTLRYIATRRDPPHTSLYVCLSHGLFTLSADRLRPIERSVLLKH